MKWGYDPRFDRNYGAHVAVISSLRNYLDNIFPSRFDRFNYRKLEHDLSVFLQPEKQSDFGGFLRDYQEYGESSYILNSWFFDLRFPVNMDDYHFNTIAEFEYGKKFLVLLSSRDWNFWDETCPYMFPAVFYSFEELKMWVVWSIKKRLKFCPADQDCKHITDDVMSIIGKYVDINLSADLLLRKLAGESKWEYGPARISEPNFDLWHEKTMDVQVNNWIRQWLVD